MLGVFKLSHLIFRSRDLNDSIEVSLKSRLKICFSDLLQTFFSPIWKDSMTAKWSEMQLFKISVLKFNVCYCISHDMVNGSCRICFCSCGFVYGWYHTITKHKVYEVFVPFWGFQNPAHSNYDRLLNVLTKTRNDLKQPETTYSEQGTT